MKEEHRVFVCEALQRIESELLLEALLSYDKKEYDGFWGGIDLIDKLLSVKQRLGCKHG